MILKGLALLASDTARTKAYLQAMIQAKLLPELCIVYSDHLDSMRAAKDGCRSHARGKYFDIEEPVLFSLEQAGIPCVMVDSKDINSEQMKTAIQDSAVEYLIYSGYGGYILKPHLFQLGKKFIHVHAGMLPQYRGSTTAYYSILQEHTIGATAIFLNEGIDEGEIIAQAQFECPKEAVDIDYIYEPFIRARVLIQVLEQYSSHGTLSSQIQPTENAETYFIIHPVLKHLALLGLENEWEADSDHNDKIRLK